MTGFSCYRRLVKRTFAENVSFESPASPLRALRCSRYDERTCPQVDAHALVVTFATAPLRLPPGSTFNFPKYTMEL